MVMWNVCDNSVARLRSSGFRINHNRLESDIVRFQVDKVHLYKSCCDDIRMFDTTLIKDANTVTVLPPPVDKCNLAII